MSSALLVFLSFVWIASPTRALWGQTGEQSSLEPFVLFSVSLRPISPIGKKYSRLSFFSPLHLSHWNDNKNIQRQHCYLVYIVRQICDVTLFVFFLSWGISHVAICAVVHEKQEASRFHYNNYVFCQHTLIWPFKTCTCMGFNVRLDHSIDT